MRATSTLLLSLSLISATFAVPVDEFNLQTVFSELPEYSRILEGLIGNVASDVEDAIERSRKTVIEDTKKVVEGVGETVQKWVENGRSYIRQYGQTCM